MLVLFGLMCARVFAQDGMANDSLDPAGHAAPPRPRIGLVLSGGGARGYAHIGVLKALEAMRIPVDCIAGTSVGALVGGLYASGMPAARLEAALSKIDLSAIALDRNERANLPQSLREDELQYPIGPSVGYQDGVFRLPAGLVQGNRLLALLQDWTAGIPADVDFDELVIPLRVVATDLENGDAIILRAGSLPLAMRASAAVPGLFAPIELAGRTLVDGGLVNNLPVNLVRQMGAGVVIAVDVSSPLFPPATLRSPASVMSQMVGILMQQNVQRQKKKLRAGDILVEPKLDKLSFEDFAAASSGIQEGWVAAWQMSAQLTALSLSPSEWETYQAQQARRRRAPNPLRVDAIEITTLGRIPPATVRQAITLREGQIYDPIMLNRELAELSTTGDFQAVNQKMVQEEGRNIVKIVANEKSWGRHFFLFGFGLSNSFNGQGSFNLQVGHRYPWINQSGLEWRNDIVLGSNTIKWHTEARQPLHPQGFYLAPYLQYDRQHRDMYQNGNAGADALPVTSYNIESVSGGLDLGVPIGRLGVLRAGLGYQQLTARPRYYGFDGRNTYTLPADRVRQPVASAELVIDQLDAPLFPRHGYYVYGSTTRGYGKTADQYGDAHVKGLWALNQGRHTVNFALEAAGTYLGSNRHIGMGFTLGGFQRLSAYAADQFTGNFLLYGRATYLYNSPDLTLPGLNDTVVGASLEIGEVWQQRSNFGQGPYKTSASLFVGGKSIAGPLYFGVAAAGYGIWNVYLRFGQVF